MANSNVRIITYVAGQRAANRTVNIITSLPAGEKALAAQFPTKTQITATQFNALPQHNRAQIPNWMPAPGSPNAKGVHSVYIAGYSAPS